MKAGSCHNVTMEACGHRRCAVGRAAEDFCKKMNGPNNRHAASSAPTYIRLSEALRLHQLLDQLLVLHDGDGDVDAGEQGLPLQLNDIHLSVAGFGRRNNQAVAAAVAVAAAAVAVAVGAAAFPAGAAAVLESGGSGIAGVFLSGSSFPEGQQIEDSMSSLGNEETTFRKKQCTL